MSKATIPLTDARDNKRIVVVWRNICYFYRRKEYTLVSFKDVSALVVGETVTQIEQAIEQAARDD